jgi:hypothetical protein
MRRRRRAKLLHVMTAKLQEGIASSSRLLVCVELSRVTFCRKEGRPTGASLTRIPAEDVLIKTHLLWVIIQNKQTRVFS